MTAFSRLDELGSDMELSWEIRSVNHRYLDISLHLPECFSKDENSLKEIIQKRLGRGKLDAKLSYSTSANLTDEAIIINEDKVRVLLKARKKLEGLSKTPMSLSVMEILNWPDVIGKSAKKTNDADLSSVKTLLISALDDLINMRELEGARLAVLLSKRCKTMAEIVESVRQRREAVQSALREKVIHKIAEIDVSADNNRLEQELVYQAQRLDVEEELDRLDSHLEEIQNVLKRDEAVGRRLDFLMQELNREANTLASKSNDTETTKSAVDMKVLIEQMREQALNIE